MSVGPQTEAKHVMERGQQLLGSGAISPNKARIDAHFATDDQIQFDDRTL